LTLDEKIAKSKENVEYEANRIYYCSYLFIAFGLSTMFMSFKELVDARLKSIFIVQEKQLPWGNANYTNFTWPNVTIASQNRLEQIIYDSLWNMCIFSILVAFFLFAMGKTALRATHKQKSRIAERMFNRHFFMFMAFLVFYVFHRKQYRMFKGTFDWIQTHDYNTSSPFLYDDATLINMTADVVEAPKRNLRARHQSRGQVYDHLLQQHEQMMDQMDMQYDKAFNQQIPDDFRHIMKKMRQQHKANKHGFKKQFHDDDEEEFDNHEHKTLKKIDMRKMLYRIYAPALWEQAQVEETTMHGHPTVMANKKDAVKDWPKLNAMCPVILFFIFACIHQICRLKFLEKELAKLEFLYKAKKLVKKTVKKQVAAVAQEQQVSALTATQEPAQVFSFMPVAQKKCKKAAKAAKAVAVQPQLVMPIIQKKIIDDVEAIPQVNESFDYSMTDPLVDEITYAPDTFSSTGVSSTKNSMM